MARVQLSLGIFALEILLRHTRKIQLEPRPKIFQIGRLYRGVRMLRTLPYVQRPEIDFSNATSRF